MNKKGQVNEQTIIAATVVIIIAMIVISVIVALISSQTEIFAVRNDTYTNSNTTCTQVSTLNCLTSLTSVTNTTTTIGINNFSICSVGGDDFGIIMDGSGTQEDLQYNGVTLNATYSEASCTQITGTTRTIVNFIPLLAAVILLVFVASMIKT